jgi:hypothetical protein
MSNAIEDLFDSIEEVASEAVEAQQLLYTVEDELLKLKRENKKLRELVRDMWHDGMCDCDEYGVCNEYGVCAKCEYGYPDRMREAGIEVG